MIKSENNNQEKEQLGLFGKFFLGAFFIVLPVFYIFFFMQDKKVSKQFEECSFYTIAFPKTITEKQKLDFYFLHNGKQYDDYVNTSANDFGYFYSQKQVLNSRYWVRVYCKDFKVNRIYWDVKVPDTLQNIPPNGWEEIPYGLGE